MITVESFRSFELEEVNNVKLLVIESDQDYVNILQALLGTNNFEISAVADPEKSLAKLADKNFDLIILNAALNDPDKDGKENLLDRIRKITLTPIIALLEIPDEQDDATLVLEGADYTLQKPFTPRRLRAAITAVLRRTEIGARASEPLLPETLTSGDLTLSLGRLEIIINNKKLNLSAREFSLLQFLMANPDRAFTREELAAQAWGWAKGGEMRAVDSSIKRLRQKIEKDTRRPDYILTERNIGYRFNPINN